MEYFHVVFTVPPIIAEIALQNRAVVYNILFRTAADTLRRIAADPKHLGAEIGFLAILHTWGQNLMHHPHVHCVVPGGGLSSDGRRWVPCRKGFFLPVRVLSRLFRGVFLHCLTQAFACGELQFHGALERLGQAVSFDDALNTARRSEWVVYTKPPFGGPAQVLEYLGRYTHRVAISNHRLVSMEDGQVAFRWKDYAHGDAHRTMTLDVGEFIRRFLLHVLPTGFVKIRHCGFLGNRHRESKLALCRKLLATPSPDPPAPTTWKERYETLTGTSVDTCPVCHQGRMVRILSIPAPPTQPIPPCAWDTS